MNGRLALRLALALGTLGPLAGCGVYGFASALGGLTGGSVAVSGVAADRILHVSGQVRVPAAITANGQLNQLSPLSSYSPLLSVAPLAGVHLYNSQALRRIQAADFGAGVVRNATVEFVDALTGSVVSTTSTSIDGRYDAQLVFKGTQHPYLAQSILRNQYNQVVGFLAAPIGADVSQPAGKHAAVDLTAATTMVAMSATLLTEAYPGFDMRTGFTGIKSSRLAAMVGTIRPSELAAAAAVLDQSKTLSDASSFNDLLSDAATASAVMTFEVKKLAEQALATDSLNVEAPGLNAAILGQLVQRMGNLTSATAGGTQGFFDTVGASVDLAQAQTQANPITTALPTLPPLPTPTPAQGVNVTFQ